MNKDHVERTRILCSDIGDPLLLTEIRLIFEVSDETQIGAGLVGEWRYFFFKRSTISR